MTASYHFHGDLRDLLRPRWRDQNPVVQKVTRKASIKDVLESMGVPHTEIDRIEWQGNQVDFSFQVAPGHSFHVYSITPPWDVSRPTVLRPTPVSAVRFIVDVNVGKLARYLRMSGVDTLYDPGWDDEEILRQTGLTNRIVLTRDSGLLKRKQVEFGRYVRAEKIDCQLREILDLFGLAGQIRPFSRCLGCNTILQPVSKEDVMNRLEPLTRKYYETFSICPACDQVFWAGSHIEHMRHQFPDLFRQG